MTFDIAYRFRTVNNGRVRRRLGKRSALNGARELQQEQQPQSVQRDEEQLTLMRIFVVLSPSCSGCLSSFVVPLIAIVRSIRVRPMELRRELVVSGIIELAD